MATKLGPIAVMLGVAATATYLAANHTGKPSAPNSTGSGTANASASATPADEAPLKRVLKETRPALEAAERKTEEELQRRQQERQLSGSTN